MANAGYVDSAGMGTIICELKHMRQEGGLISLVNVAPHVYRALTLMRVMDFMPVSRAGMRRSVRELDPLGASGVEAHLPRGGRPDGPGPRAGRVPLRGTAA